MASKLFVRNHKYKNLHRAFTRRKLKQIFTQKKQTYSADSRKYAQNAPQNYEHRLFCNKIYCRYFGSTMANLSPGIVPTKKVVE